jgi:hypothetical protein
MFLNKKPSDLNKIESQNKESKTENLLQDQKIVK